MRDVEISPARVRDPVGRRFPALGRDPERAPMQWDASVNAGFTPAADPWLPVAPDAPHVNVEAQSADPASLLSFYRRAIWYRRSSVALTQGAYRSLPAPPDVFLYLREHARQQVLVALNFAGETRTVDLPSAYRGVIVLATRFGRQGTVAGHLELGANEGVAVELEQS
jgi:alpha-glucosidase